MSVLSSDARVKDWLGGAYYLHHTMSPDMDSIRKGMIALIECEGMDWSKKPDFKLQAKMFSELLTVYPFTGVAKHYHTGMIFNLLATLFKKFLPSDLKNRFQLGMQCDSRLDAIYLVPTPEIARARMLVRLQETLERRYENEKHFTLSDDDPSEWS